jgi:hypothetical protein
MGLPLAVAAFAVSVLVHAVALRLARGVGAVAGFVLIGGAVGIALVGLSFAVFGFTPAFGATVLSYAFLCELYIFLFTLVANSVSFALMTRLARQPLQPAQIAEFYRTEAMLSRRYQQLEQAGYIVAEQGGFALTPQGRMVVSVFSFLRALFRRPHPGGVDTVLSDRRVQ